MNITKSKFFKLLTYTGMVTVMILILSNNVYAGNTTCLSLPGVNSGTVVDNQFITGNVSFSTNYDGFLTNSLQPFYSIDGGGKWYAIPGNYGNPVPNVNANSISLKDGRIVSLGYEQDASSGTLGNKVVLYIYTPTPFGGFVGSREIARTFDTTNTSLKIVEMDDGRIFVTWIKYFVYSGGTVVSKKRIVGRTVDLSTFALGTVYNINSTISLNGFSNLVSIGNSIYSTIVNAGLGSYGATIYNLNINTGSVTTGFLFSSNSYPFTTAEGTIRLERSPGDNLVVEYKTRYSSKSTIKIFSSDLTPIANSQIDTYIPDLVVPDRLIQIDSNYSLFSWWGRLSDQDNSTGIKGVVLSNATLTAAGNSFTIADSSQIQNGSSIWPVYRRIKLPSGDILFFWIEILSDGSRTAHFTTRKTDGTISETQSVANIGDISPVQIDYFDSSGLQLLSQYYALTSGGMLFKFNSSLVTNPINITGDVSVQFRIHDTLTNSDCDSPIRNYIYASAEDGNDISLTYLDGITNKTSEIVSINTVCSSCTSLQLYESKAQYNNQTCSSYGPWSIYGDNSTLKTQENVALEDAYCYRYRADATNIVGNTYTATSNSVIRSDQIPPIVNVVSENRVWDNLTVDVDVVDGGSGIKATRYSLNNGPESEFTGNSFQITVVDGINKLSIIGEDNAGNITQINRYYSVDLTPPEITILGIAEGDTYGPDIQFTYSMTQDLTNVKLFVDGVEGGSLTGLSDGQHSIKITGLDAQGNVVSKIVNFNVDSTVFSLSLLSPSSSTYQTGNITIAYSTSKPAQNIWYTLNGGASQTNLQLTNLADGNYTIVLYAQSSDGTVVSKSSAFSVKNAIPVLNVVSPEAGAIYPDNKVKVEFASDSQVSYILDGKSGVITTGSELPVSSDGTHTLTLTATHPVSGNVVSQTIDFRTDTVPLELELFSPRSILYVDPTVLVDYKSNKILDAVTMTLDGNPIQNLSNLGIGTHNFSLTAKDSAGRELTKNVQFRIADLQLLSPADGQNIYLTTQQNYTPLIFQASGSFDAFGYSSDFGPEQSIKEPPGGITPLNLEPGTHSLKLIARDNEFVVSKQSTFNVGVKNIKGYLNYTYDKCNPTLNTCTVNAFMKLENTGNFTVSNTIQVQLDHIASLGFQTQIKSIPSLGIGEKTILNFDPFTANIGDILSATIDPQSSLTDEYNDDNKQEVIFTKGGIVSATDYQFDFDNLSVKSVKDIKDDVNVYIEGVSSLKRLHVDTVGPIVSVAVSVNGMTFVDDIADDGFDIMLDMKSLSVSNSCILISAKDTNGNILDGVEQCYKIKKLNINNISKFTIDWSSFEQASNVVNTNDIDNVALLTELANDRYQTLKQSISLFPQFETNGGVAYRLLADPTSVIQYPQLNVAGFGDIPIVGGNAGIVNGRFMYSINATNNSCYASSVLNVDDDFLAKIYQKEVDDIKFAASIGSPTWLQSFLSGTGLPVITSFPFLQTDLGGVPFELGYSYMGWTNIELPDKFIEVKPDFTLTNGFANRGCELVDNNNRLDMTTHASYDFDLDGKINFNTGKLNVHTLGVLQPYYKIAGISDSILGHFVDALDIFSWYLNFTGYYSYTLYEQKINVPIRMGYQLAMSFANSEMSFGPSNQYRYVRVKHNARLSDEDARLYPWILYSLVGFGQDVRAYIHLNGYSNYDYLRGSNENYNFNYLKYDGEIDLFKRYKLCILNLCMVSGFSNAGKTYDEHDVSGTEYTTADVLSAYQSLDPYRISW